MATLSMEDLLEKAENIYEVVVIMTRRARQINDEQKLLIDMEKEVSPQTENRDNDDFDEVEIDREALMREHKKYPKPTRLAIEEMVKKRIKHEYSSSENEKE
jgi:DNA-directed RNA polymerase omega subunit